MQLIHPSVKLETSDNMILEFMDIIENAGRTCWQSFGKKEDQIKKLLCLKSFDPYSYDGWKNWKVDPFDYTGFDSQTPEGKDWAHRTRLAIRTVNHRFIQHIIKAGHLSVLEHSAITVRIVTDRAVSHQLVRHRIGSYSQESQRYVDYNKNGQIVFILPEGLDLEPGYYEFKEGQQQEYPFKILRFPEKMALCPRKGESIEDWPVGIGYLKDRESQAKEVDCSKLSSAHVSMIRAYSDAEETYQSLRVKGVKPQDARSVLPNSTKTEIVATMNISQWRHVLKTRLHPSAQHDIRQIMGIILELFMESPMAIIFKDIKDERKHQDNDD